MILTNHGAHLGDAFSSIASKPTTMRVKVASEGIEINQGLLCLFSPFIRNVVSCVNLHEGLSNLLIIPDCNPESLKDLSDILTTGVTLGTCRSSPEDILQLARILGISLSRLDREELAVNYIPIINTPSLQENPDDLMENVDDPNFESRKVSYLGGIGDNLIYGVEFPPCNPDNNHTESLDPYTEESTGDNIFDHGKFSSLRESIKGIVGRSLGMSGDRVPFVSDNTGRGKYY